MATKEDYSKMTSKKLNGLLSAVSAEEAVIINEVLASREQQKSEVPAGDATGEQSTEEGKEVAEKATPEKPKMSDDECAALVTKLTADYVGHKCSVVPFNTAEWVDGIVTNIINDKRTNKPLIGIKIVADGHRIVKAYDSKLVKVSEETVEMTSSRGGNRSKKEMSDEQLQADLTAAGLVIGHKVSFKAFKGEEVVSGTAITAYIDKRSERVIVRIKLEDGALAHKTFGSPMEVSEEVDEKIAAAYAEAEAVRNEIAKSPEKRQEVAAAALKSAQNELERITKLVAARQADFDASVEAVKAAALEAEAIDPLA